MLNERSMAFADLDYSVVHRTCLENVSYIHEIGHNLGANHDKENARLMPNDVYNHGYRQCNGSVRHLYNKGLCR